MITGIIIGAVLALAVLWAIGVRHRLTAMGENIDSAMNQIGIQLSSSFDALTSLLDLAGGYSAREAQPLIETVRSRRSDITAHSEPDDISGQEAVIAETLGGLSALAERYPELKADEGYLKYMNAVDGYGKMVRTSRLIYNDAVTRLNRELRTFPTSLIGGVLGFHRRGYLVAAEEPSGMR